MTERNVMNTRSKASTAVIIGLAATMLLYGLAFAAKKQKNAAENAVEKAKPAIELGAPFADNAILQREMPVPVWGWSAPGTRVTVEFAGQKKTAVAGQDGKWMARLDALAASAEPREMIVADSEGKKVVLKNVLVGEVWLASGQSNMQWIANQSSSSIVAKNLVDEAKAKGKLPPIREGKVTNVYSSLHPVEHAHGVWSDGSDLSGYSAIALAFASELCKELNVPIGILNCAFSTTSIQAWTPREGFADGTDEYTRGLYKRILEGDPTTPEHKAAWDAFYRDIENTIKENGERIRNGQEPQAISKKTPGNLDGNRDACWMFNGKINPMVPYAIRGAIWNQGYASIGEGTLYYNNLHSLIRGWRKVWGQGDFPVYFHQFYCPSADDGLSLNSMAEMRLGTWLARDIPHANMASQIDIGGAVHYYNKALPGKRLALHALKNQYGKKIVADGPMFKSYKVEGERLIVEFDFAAGGLVVAKTTMGRGLETPAGIENGEGQVTLFYLAGQDRVWHRAKLKIDGEKVVLTAPGVAAPRGVAYGCNGIGTSPNLYNRALLPTTPFIYYDNKLVTKAAWLDDPLKVAGVTPDPNSGGKRYEYRKMPLVGAQFRDNAVFQAGMPVTFWGSAVHDWGYEAKGKALIKFRFAGVEKTIPVAPRMREWRVTVPPMQASAEPKTLKVVFEIDGEVAHEREYKNIVIGDVWYVAAALAKQKSKGKAGEPDDGMVRFMTRRANRSTSPRPSRFSVSISTTPENRFDSEWTSADGGLAGELGRRIHAKTGQPVGIIFMSGDELQVKHWIRFDYLKHAPSLVGDYEHLSSVTPGNPLYDATARRYIADWKKYWSESVPQLIATKQAMNGAAWGTYPSLSPATTSEAGQAYNVMVHCFGPGSFEGIIFLSDAEMFQKDQGANYGPELSALANCWKDWFACPDPCFLYTIPSKKLAPKVTLPTAIQGKSVAVEIDDWADATTKIIERAVGEVQSPTSKGTRE